MHLEKVFGRHGRIPGADIMTWKKKIRGRVNWISYLQFKDFSKFWNISETSEQIKKVTKKNESMIIRLSIFTLTR